MDGLKSHIAELTSEAEANTQELMQLRTAAEGKV